MLELSNKTPAPNPTNATVPLNDAPIAFLPPALPEEKGKVIRFIEIEQGFATL